MRMGKSKIFVFFLIFLSIHDTFKIASWNIGTMRGRSSEIVETITRRNIDLCCVQEVRWRGASA